jgi:hypothetical protein
LLLFHSTPGRNSYSIFSLGVTIESALTPPKRIWLHTWRKRKWARLHLAVRYKVDPRHITSFAVDIPRSWLTRHSRGLWKCERTIPGCRLIGQTFFLTDAQLNDDTLFGFDFDIFSAPGQVPGVHPLTLPREALPGQS